MVLVVLISICCLCLCLKTTVLSPSPETADLVNLYHSKKLETTVITGRVLYTKKDSEDRFSVKYPNHPDNGQDFLILDSVIPFGSDEGGVFLSFCEWSNPEGLVGAVMKSTDLVYWERITELGDLDCYLTNMASDGKTTLFSHSTSDEVYVNTDGLTSSNVTLGIRFPYDCWWWVRYDPSSKLFIEYANTCHKDVPKGARMYLSKDGFHWDPQESFHQEIQDLRVLDDGTWVISMGDKVYISKDQGKSLKRIFWHILEEKDDDPNFALSIVYSADCTESGVCGVVILTDYFLATFNKALLYVSSKNFKDFKLVYSGKHSGIFEDSPVVSIANDDIYFYKYGLLTFDYIVYNHKTGKTGRIHSEGWQDEIYKIEKSETSDNYLSTSQTSFLVSKSQDDGSFDWISVPSPGDKFGCLGAPYYFYELKNGEKQLYVYYCAGSQSIQTSTDVSSSKSFESKKFPSDIESGSVSFSSKFGEDSFGFVSFGRNNTSSSSSYPVFFYSTLLPSGELSDFFSYKIGTKGGVDYQGITASKSMSSPDDNKIYYIQTDGIWYSNSTGKSTWYEVMSLSWKDEIENFAVRFEDRIVVLVNRAKIQVWNIKDDSFSLICKTKVPEGYKDVNVLKYLENIDVFAIISNGHIATSSDGCNWKILGMDGTYLYLNDLVSDGNDQVLGVGQNGVTILFEEF